MTERDHDVMTLRTAHGQSEEVAADPVLAERVFAPPIGQARRWASRR